MKNLGGRLLAVILLTAACTETVAPSPTVTLTTTTLPGVTPTTITPEQGAADFRACLADRGIRIEEVPFDAAGHPRLDLVLPRIDFADPEDLRALDSCAVHLSTGALELTGSGLVGEAVIDLLGEFADCVRSKGVPGFPDPITGFNGVGGPFDLDQIPYGDPDLPSAVETCRERVFAG